MIKQYIRDPKTNRKIGVMVGMKLGGYISVGFSALHTKDKGTFNPEFGTEIAESRAICYASDDRWPEIPFKVRPNLQNFIDRCKIYFKGADILPWIEDLEVDLECIYPPVEGRV